MKEFKIKPEGYKELRKELIPKTILIMLTAILAGLTIAYFNIEKASDVKNILPVVLPIVALALFVGFWRADKTIKKQFESYTLTFDDTTITRKQLNTPALSISHTEIEEIVKNSNNSITVKGSSRFNMIGIPAQIDNYAELETLLHNLKPLTVKSEKTFLQRLLIPTILITLTLMITLATSTNKLIVGVSGAILLIEMLICYVIIQRSKHIDDDMKKKFRSFLYIMLALAYILYTKLTA